MDCAAVPLIYSVRPEGCRVGIFHRLMALGVSVICLLMLITAALLKPDPSGMGTHTVLGLAPCSMPRLWGIPCPSCGMTTSWAWLARGNIAASLWIQPMGTVLAIGAIAVFWAGLYIAVTGRAANLLLRYLPGGYIAGSALALALLAWMWKIYIQLHHLDGWTSN